MRKLPNGHIPRGLHPGDPLGLNGCVTVRSMENYQPFEADMADSAMHTHAHTARAGVVRDQLKAVPQQVAVAGLGAVLWRRGRKGGGDAGDGCEVTQGR
jgi:hypothetical protein